MKKMKRMKEEDKWWNMEKRRKTVEAQEWRDRS
jgi:hypothetical protein